MTFERIYVPALDVFEQDALDSLLLQWSSLRTRNNLRAGFYDMTNATRALTASELPPAVKSRAFVLGWSALAVDKLTRRCNLDGYYSSDGTDLDALGMDEIFDDNKLGSEINQGGSVGLIHGVSFLMTTQGDVQADEPDVLIHSTSALDSTATWSARRREIDKFLSITDYDDVGQPSEITLMLPNLNVFITKTGSGWQVDRREHVYGVPVDPLRWKPRTGVPFGVSRINRAVMSIHVQAIAAMVRADVNGEVYSLPRYALLGVREGDFVNADGSPKASWQAAWDAIWSIGDDESMIGTEAPQLARADVKQFLGQSPEPQNAHLRMLAQMFSGETGIPLGELGIVGDGNPTSYEALMASRDDIISTAELTTDDWGPDVARAMQRALQMKNRDPSIDVDVVPLWRSPQHQSRAAAADAGSKVVAAVPWLAESEVGLELLGLSSDQITRAMNDKRRMVGRVLLDQIAANGGANPAAS